MVRAPSVHRVQARIQHGRLVAISTALLHMTTPTMSRNERDQLTHWRNINARRSVDICSIAPRVLKAGGLGDEEWSVREQLAFAALDMGAMGLAEVSSSAATRSPCSHYIEQGLVWHQARKVS